VTEEETSAEGKNLGFAVDQQVILANQEFVDANPAAEKFFELVEVPIGDVSAQNQLMQDGEDTPELTDEATWVAHIHTLATGHSTKALSPSGERALASSLQ
jgi:ABC-type proline/glycine betaine transport system substrate-binding protein